MSTHEKKPLNRRALGLALGLVVIVGGGAMTAAYVGVSSRVISIDNSKLEAPTVDLSATQGGILRALNVAAGQVISANTVVAQVGVELIKSTQGGLVLSTQGDIGDQVNAGQTVVEMIDPTSLRVVGEIDENKGLSSIHVGDPVYFTVDAFGSKKFVGVVDEVSPTSNQSGVVFNISDQRAVQQFNIKARFDTVQYPELRNGMSARMYVYIK